MKWIKTIASIVSIFVIVGIIILAVLTGIYRFDTLYLVLIASIVAIHIVNSIFGIYIYFNEDRSDLTKKSWLFSLLLFPAIGPIIFLWTGFYPFTKNKMKLLDKSIEHVRQISGYYKQKLVDAKVTGLQNIYSYCSNVSINKTTDGKITLINQNDLYDECINAIRSAKKYIFINFYIFREGVFMKTVFNEIYKKSLEGVKIFILYDWVGSRKKIDKKFFKKLNDYENINAYTFKKKSFFIVNSFDNSRNHKKALIIDNKLAIIGGFNLADEYINENSDFSYWRDHAFLARGNVINDYLKIFLLDWVNYTKCEDDEIDKIISSLINYKNKNTNNNQIIQTYNSFPEKNIWKAFTLYAMILSRVTKRVWINTPYFYPTEQLERILIGLAKSGVDVRIVLPGKPDDKKFIVDINRWTYFKWLENGIKIYEFDGFTHCKSIIIDDNISVIGTINLDPRALNINYEISNIVYDKKLNQELEKEFLQTIENSSEINGKVKHMTLSRRIYGKIIIILLLFFEPLL